MGITHSCSATCICWVASMTELCLINSAALTMCGILDGHALRLGWGGGGLQSTIYRNLLQFYCNFAVMPLFKNFFFPLKKILSLPSLSLGTLSLGTRVCVLICPECHLCGRTLFCFCVPKMSSNSGDSDSANGKRPVKRRKVQGGQKARYATQISPAAPAVQYPNEPFTVKQTDAGERLWCMCCGKPVSHQTVGLDACAESLGAVCMLCAESLTILPIGCIIGQKNLFAKSPVLHCCSWLA